MKDAVQGAVLFFTLLFVASISEADELSQVLQSHFSQDAEASFIRYESVEQNTLDEFGVQKYLVMDFNTPLASQIDLQQSIHVICSRVLADRALIRRLSDQGYDMISVSFDRQSQYDCL